MHIVLKMVSRVRSTKEQLYRLITEAIDAGDLSRAHEFCQKLNEHYEDYFEGWSIASELHLRLRNPESGLEAIERALTLRPNDIQAQLQRVHCWIALKRHAEAREALLHLSRYQFREANIPNHLGMLLVRLNLYEEALEQYLKAAQLEPRLASSHYNVAAVQRFTGDLEAAEISLNKALALNPFDYEGQMMRSSLRKLSQSDNHIDELRSLLVDKRLSEQGRIHICHALAKEFDDCDLPDQSFKYLKKGADQRRKQMSYQVHIDLEIMEEIEAAYTSDVFARGISGDVSVEPIFVVGLPRTGTTLVEQILGSHSEVVSVGEIHNFAMTMMSQARGLGSGKNLSRVELVRRTVGIDFAKLGRDYIASTRPSTGSAPHFVDKLPFNFLYLGLIHLSLPNAKIINLTRHPMAACYAIYKQLFQEAYPFSYDMKDLGQYYVAYHRLMRHWADVMPGRLYTLAYEELVTDTETQARKLLAHCELEWQEGCLKFHDSKQASTTASAAQVRQPIYTSSLDRWRRYENHLRPLADILRKAGVKIDS